MLKQNKKKNILIRFFLSPYFFTFACLIVLAVIIYPVYQNASRRYEVDKEISDLSKQITSLESGNDDLKKLKAYLESDQFAEKSARLDLGLKMKGEQVAVVDATGLGSAADDQTKTDSNNGENKNSNPVKWWNYFFGQ
jgi:cell division protein FtsL